MSAPDRKLTHLRVAFQRHGITKRADVLRLAGEDVGRYLWSTKAMTEAEVDALIARLERLPVGGLPSHAARLEREQAARQPARVMVCTRGGKEPTEHDLAVVAEFGEQLDVLAAAGLLPAGAPDRHRRDPG